MTHRRHSPTDGGNRSGGGRKFAGKVHSGTLGALGALGVVVVPGGRDVSQLAGAFVSGIQPRHHTGGDEADQTAHMHCGQPLVAETWNLALGTSEEFCQVFRRPKWRDGFVVGDCGGGHTLAFVVKNQGGRSGLPIGS